MLTDDAKRLAKSSLRDKYKELADGQNKAVVCAAAYGLSRRLYVVQEEAPRSHRLDGSVMCL